jgi:hypothetical protein
MPTKAVLGTLLMLTEGDARDPGGADYGGTRDALLTQSKAVLGTLVILTKVVPETLVIRTKAVLETPLTH